MKKSNVPDIRKRVLFVEDNEKIMSNNLWFFNRAGYMAIATLTLNDARASLNECRPDVIVLDIMLPDGSGLDFIRELRASDKADIPVLLLTGLSERDDIVRGLSEGGDDYLTKPYDFQVLLARVEALVRRSERVPETIIKDRLSLDLTANIAFLDKTDLLLAQKEFALLLIFAQNEGRFISAEYLYKKVWKGLTNDSQALKLAIHRLRTKINGSGWFIEWSRGEGYCFQKG